MKLDFRLNMKVVGLCLIFLMRNYVLNLDISSESYVMITEEC